jgi:cell division protein FtsW (lipid II flippase)
MIRRNFAPELAVLLILCTLGIFFFPALSGPYPSVHGPVTAMRAMRAWLLLLIAFILAFTSMMQWSVTRLEARVEAGDPPDRNLFESSSVLRC